MFSDGRNAKPTPNIIGIVISYSYKGSEPDPRVTERIIYCDYQYAVCFLNPDDAKAISLYKDQNEKVAIYCDVGAINANTDIIHINGHFFASQELKRNHCTMIPCLSGSVSQQKRMSGLIIDIRMLLDLFASIGGKVLRDELGSLQIYGDIPWHCVVALLEDDEMSRFWEGVPVEEESESDGYDSCDEYYRQYNHYDDDHWTVDLLCPVIFLSMLLFVYFRMLR